jgi:pimeloyl-ACP methyl ester carboxylesterase
VSVPAIEGAGVSLSYTELGSGSPALLIHDIASDAAALAGLAASLAAAGMRAIAYNRRGYGDSGAPEPYDGTTVGEQSRDAVALLHGLDAAPALLVAQGWGALIALELAIREPALVRAVAASDPPAYAFVPEATEELSAQRAMLEQALANGGPPAAVGAWLGDVAAATDAGARAQRAHRAFFADYAGLASWIVTGAALRAIAAPVTLVTGSQTRPAVRAATDALAQRCPAATRRDDGDLTAAAVALAASL